jgi:hypothetical protein
MLREYNTERRLVLARLRLRPTRFIGHLKLRVCAVRFNDSPAGGKSGKIGVAKRAAIVLLTAWQEPSSPRRSALTNARTDTLAVARRSDAA